MDGLVWLFHMWHVCQPLACGLGGVKIESLIVLYSYHMDIDIEELDVSILRLNLTAPCMHLRSV
jgi:hypothetical protein